MAVCKNYHMERGRFTNEDKERVRDKLHWPNHPRCGFNMGECDRPVRSGIVHHETGVFEAKLEGRDLNQVANAWENGNLYCDLHIVWHDIQEREHIKQFYGRKYKKGRI